MKKLLLAFFLFTLPLSAAQVEEFVLSPAKGIPWSTSPSLTRDEVSGKILAVWQKHPQTHQGRTIFGRLISAAGKPSGGIFPIVTGDSTFFPEVVYNPVTKEFLLVYSRDRGDIHLEIVGQRLSLRGRKKGSPVRLSPAADLNLNLENDRPIATVDPSDGSYFVTWLRSGLNATVISGEGVIGARFDRNLNPIGSPVLLHVLNRATGAILGPYVNDMKIHQSGKIVLLMNSVNITGTVSTSTYFTMAIDSQNIAPAPVKLIKSTPSKFFGGGTLLIGPADHSFVFISDTKALKRRAIGTSGEPTGALSPAFATPARSKRVGLPNASLFEDDFLILSGIEFPADVTQNRSIWVQKLVATGKPSGAPEVLKSVPTALELFALPLPVANGVHTLLLVYSDGQTFGQPSGLVLLRVTF